MLDKKHILGQHGPVPIHRGLGATLLSRHEGKVPLVKEIFASQLATLVKHILTRNLKIHLYTYIQPRIRAKFI